MADKAPAAKKSANPVPTTDEAKRQELRDKIAQGEERNNERSLGDRAREAAETSADFVKRHPLATIAGGVTLGLLIGAMTRPGRRVTRKVGRRSSALAALAADAALAYGVRVLDGAGDLARGAGNRFEDLGDNVGLRTRGLRRDAAHRADALGVKLGSAKRKSSRTMRSLRDRLTH